MYFVSKLLMISLLKKILLIIAISLTMVKVNRTNGVATTWQENQANLFDSSAINSNSTFAPIYAQVRSSCQKLGSDYEKVYNFVTQNFYIGICRRGENFYYYRQSKSNPRKLVVLKATIVLGGDVFKAEKGKVTYFVGTNANGYYSSVMQPNHEIIVEPEINQNKLSIELEDLLNKSLVLP